MSASIRTAVLVAFAGLVVSAPGASGQSAHVFTDWTSVSGGVAEGTLSGRSVSLSGSDVSSPPASTLDGSSTVFNRPEFSPPLPASDAIQFIGSPGGSYTLRFGAPVTDPVLHLGSLASTLEFPAGTQITRLSGDSQFSVSGSTVSGAVEEPTDDANGSVRLSGTFTSIAFTATFQGSDGIYLQAGVAVDSPGGGGGGGGGGGPGPAPGPASPQITALRQLPSLGAGRPAVVTAQVSGEYSRLVWNLRGNGRPELISGVGQTTVRFRPRAATTTIGVRAIGRGGTSALASLTATRPKLLRGSFSRRIEGRLAARPVDAAGPVGLLLNRAAPSFNCLAGDPARRVRVRSGALDIEGGCLGPISSLEDIPPGERGIIEQLARQFDIPRRSDAVQTDAVQTGIGLSDAYLSRGEVLINGVKFDPGRGAAVVIYPQVNAIASSNASMSVGNLKLANPSRFILNTQPRGGRIPFCSCALSGAGAKALGAFKLFGDVKVEAVPGGPGFDGLPGAVITANLKLPPFLTVGGSDLQSQVQLRATTDRGLILDGMRIGPLDADLGALNVRQFRIDYAREGGADVWRGQGKACVIGGTCLDMVPDRGSVVIKNGELDFAGATLDFPPPGPPLFAGVNLESIGFNFGLNPTRAGGNATVSVLKVYEINGRLILAFPDSATPYVLDRREVGDGFPPSFYGRRHTEATVGITANASLRAPLVGKIALGNGYFLYEYPGYVAFGGGIDQDFLVATFKGYLTGEINTQKARYNIFGKTETCITPLFCYGSDAVVSNRGAAGCVRPGVLPDFGLGVYWQPYEVVPQLDGSCKWSPFAEFNVKGDAATAQAGDPLEIRIGPGDRGRTLRLDGADGAPRVRVTGPGGQTLESAAPPYAARGALRILHLDRVKTTAVGLKDPRPGVYRIEPLTGSTPVTEIAQAIEQPDAKITGQVKGSGTRRVLSYDIRRRRAQRVRFFEITAAGGSREIGTVRGGGRGKLRFSTAPGRGVRRIEARFELAGLAAEREFAARFAAPSPRLARPRRLRVRRRGTSLNVNWAPVAGARRYELVTTTTGGGSRMRRTRGRRTVIKGIDKSSAGRVTVRAVDRLREGRPAKVRFRRTARRATRFGRLPRVPRLR